ncbi:hypothetical protein jhhlp_007383 [Lomentospora prolificans]|uniref:Uncharacterized protein n=1 Tax=Lomentospora prolificans TaxID=41688 RepID=A0A2N3N2I6_9PEZI|nr:hypothetical protein jhhlp_007383 [Lomentospora prolificans]
MSDNESLAGDHDHQAAYIFDPRGEDARTERPSKRRRTSKKAPKSKPKAAGPVALTSKRSYFVPLMHEAEKPEMVEKREMLFKKSWSHVESRIKHMLRDANSATLKEVGNFVRDAKNRRWNGRETIPCAFVVAGPNLASQDLLFEQLEESLVGSTENNKFVRLRSADVSNTKAALKKIIQDITCKASGDEDGQLTIGKSNRKYLNYDLAAVHALLTAQGGCDHVFIAFQDSEGFDSSLLSDLILIFSNWTQIPFTLLFGIATSVELLQNRLRKSVCEYIQGTEFDVTQGTSVLEEIILKVAVTSPDIPLLIGGPLLESMIKRQHEKVAGVQDFISALKYAYMTHFYANPLSVFVGFESWEADWIQPEQALALRSSPSFKRRIDGFADDSENAQYSRTMVVDLFKDDKLLVEELSEVGLNKAQYGAQILRAVKCLAAVRYRNGNPTAITLELLSHKGINLTDDHDAIVTLRKMDPERVIAVMKDMRAALSENNYGEIPDNTGSKLGLELASEAATDGKICEALSERIRRAEGLLVKAKEQGRTLRSKYSGQTKIVRTTVVAQKVQLSHDSAALTEVDEDFTKLVDELVVEVKRSGMVPPATTWLFNEVWYYDSKIPHKEVFIPRLRTVFERALGRPHDYLGCTCCGDDTEGVDAISPLSPPASILYHFYQEAGSLINVADLWTAFYGVVGSDSGDDADETAALALFYQGLAELKSLGFVKPSKKKTDHVAKLKWL